MARGGQRTPARPAPVSGPGRLSRRTDGKQPMRDIPAQSYGDRADFLDIQSSAPMAKAASATPNVKQGSAAAVGATTPPPTPLSAPTQRPDEPVTEGNPMGPGAGPSVLSNPAPRQQSALEAQALKKYLPALSAMANTEGAPPSFVRFVQYLRDV